MESKYISVAEFAKQVGVSKQAVYSRLDKDLKEFVKLIDGKKMLDTNAFCRFSKKEKVQVENQVDSKVESSFNQVESDTIRHFTTIFDEQLKAKDKQIEQLQKQIEQLQLAAVEKDRHIQAQAEKLTSLLEQSNILQHNTQRLLAENKKEIVEDIAEEQPQEEAKQETKKGFWHRLFVGK